jgi:hypothetical protein
MIIYGWGKDLKKIAYAGIEKCSNCKNHSHFWIGETSSHATLYFVKVAKWNKKYYFCCETCQRGFEIAPGRLDELLRASVKLPSQQQCREIWDHLDLAARHALDQKLPPDELVKHFFQTIGDDVALLKKKFQAEYVDYVAGVYVRYQMDRGDDEPKPVTVEPKPAPAVEPSEPVPVVKPNETSTQPGPPTAPLLVFLFLVLALIAVWVALSIPSQTEKKEIQPHSDSKDPKRKRAGRVLWWLMGWKPSELLPSVAASRKTVLGFSIRQYECAGGTVIDKEELR